VPTACDHLSFEPARQGSLMRGFFCCWVAGGWMLAGGESTESMASSDSVQGAYACCSGRSAWSASPINLKLFP
jgi:hypothetical protein